MKKLTVLVIPIDAIGHTNACAGTTLPLLKRGHRIVFVLEEAFKDKLKKLGFEEDIYKLTTNDDDSKNGNWANDLLATGIIGPASVEDKYKKIIELFNLSDYALNKMKQTDEYVRKSISHYRPDAIMIDSGYLLPCVYYSGIPWINHTSMTALTHACTESEDMPPASSGFASNAVRDKRWNNFKQLNIDSKYSKYFHDFIETMGYKRYPEDRVFPLESSIFTLYACPNDINYDYIQAKNWFNLEVFNRHELCNIEKIDLTELLPREFLYASLNQEWTGKWIYISMGTLGSIDLELMKRIMDAASETKHKFVVSKGPRSDEYDLPVNAWGDAYLPQTKLIPSMDLVITHGGNNTFTETFALGKPMIVMALFGDQHDNAQRIDETGFGVRLDPYRFEKQKMIDAIEQLVNNDQLNQKLKDASHRILSSTKHDELCDQIERLLSKN